MATERQHALRDAIGEAIAEHRWDDAELGLDDLLPALQAVVRDRSARGPRAAQARAFHRDGLYNLGFQALMGAPESLRRKATEYNRVLAKIGRLG